MVHETLIAFLESHRIEVRVLTNSHSLIPRVEDDAPSLIVLCDGLLDMTAAAMLQSLRRAGDDTPVIVIGEARDSVDPVICLELGADDYLRSPCIPRELLSRVHNVLRRAQRKTPPLERASERCVLGALVVDFKSRSAMLGGLPITMPYSLFALLRLFAEHPLEVLTRRNIGDRLKGVSNSHCDRSLDVLVWRLRRIVESDPSQPRFIQTIRGRGYVFAPFESGFDFAVQGRLRS
jgi:two-component system phosphate regulon response regulator OmpR